MGETKEDSAIAQLVTQSFGKESEYRRAWLCLMSYAAHHPLGIHAPIILFTDNTSFFKQRLAGFNIEYILLTPEKIKTMRGEIDFLHRMKIALIHEAFELHPGNILYADSDTFFIADPSSVSGQVANNRAFMHVHEYEFEYLKTIPLPAGEPFVAFYNLITSKKILDAAGHEISISPKQSSWNAGVMFLHASHHQLLPDVFALTDQFYPDTRNHASEQYAFSLVLQNKTVLSACDNVIYHYWYRIKKVIVDDWLIGFEKEIEDQLTDDQIKEIKRWTGKLPTLLETHVLTLQDNAIQAFHENQFAKGYRFAIKAFMKKPRDGKFLRDIAYHSRRAIKIKLGVA